MDLCEFKASLVYRASSRTVKAVQRNPVSENQKTKKRENSDLMAPGKRNRDRETESESRTNK